MSRDRTERARGKVAEATRLMKKSLFHKPDPNAAAPLYEEAGRLYMTLQDHRNSMKCHLLAADCNRRVDNLVLCGKNLEAAASILAKRRKFVESIEYWEKAHIAYMEDGKPDLAMAALVKGATALQKTNGRIDQVIDLYKRAISIMADGDKFHYGMNHLRNFNTYLIRQERWQDVLENIRFQKRAFKFLKQQHNIWKANLCVTIVCCKMGDLVLADEYNEQFCREEQEYSSQIEFTVSDRLIAICDARDEAGFEAMKTDETVKYVEPAFYRIVKRKISLDDIEGNRKPGMRILLDDEMTDSGSEPDEEEEGELEGNL